MSENSSQFPQNFESTNSPNSPSFDMPPVHPQYPNLYFQNNWQLPPLTKQQLNEMILSDHYGVGDGGSQMNFGLEVQRTGQSRQSTPLLHRQLLSQLYNRQDQMLLQQQPRQKASLDQILQSNLSNSSDLGLKSLGMGMINTFEANQQTRAYGQLLYGQHMNSQNRQQHQHMILQNHLLSSQLQGQPLQRGSSISSINPQFSWLTQSSQPTTIQNVFRLQPCMKKMQPVSSSNNIQREHQIFLLQQSSSSQIPLQNSFNLTQQRLAQLLQCQGPLGSQCQHQSSQYLNSQHVMQQFQWKQQESPRVQASSGYQKVTSLGGSQPAPCVSASKNTDSGGSSIQGANASIPLLGKRKIQDLVSQVDPQVNLDPAVEDLLLEIADDFIDSVTTFACNLAKHRKSSTLEAKDILLHLEKNLQLNIPGYTKDGKTSRNGLLSRNVHTEKLDSIRSSVESQHFERSLRIHSFPTDSSRQQPLRPSPGSEQFILFAGAPQMPQEAKHF